MDWEKRPYAWVTEEAERYDKAFEENTVLRARIAALEGALRKYADKSMWRQEVIDSTSGQVSIFDWVNDPRDYTYGWEIAEEALNPESKRAALTRASYGAL